MRALLLLLGVSLFGCSASNNIFFGSGGAGTTGPSSSSGATTGSGGAAESTSGSGGVGGIDFNVDGGPSDGSTPPSAEVFANGPNVLYRLDPDTDVFTTVGTFQGCNGESVIDIAIDKNGAMFATTFGGLYTVDKDTATCTLVQQGGYPNSLSFVPQGTLDPNDEALVGYNGGTYVRIDKITGAVTTVGTLGGGYASSGDIVSVIGGGTYLTVNGNGCGDCIVQVNPTNGALINLIGPLGHSSVFGLAYWGGSAYGFDDAGELFQINLSNGQTTIIPTMPGLEFYGAGSTTAAPLVPPT